MLTYPKIETLYDRSTVDFKVTDVLRRPEFGLVDRWVVTEKIDGTNIRVNYSADHDEVSFHGRTDRAEIPKHLLERLEEQFGEHFSEEAFEYCQLWNLDSFTMYGEGFGPKIQKGGGNYGEYVDFIGFDIAVDGSTWLQYDSMRTVFGNFGIPVVPEHALAGRNTADIVEYCREGFPSSLSDKVEVCEGVVARPRYNLFNQRGERVMWKLKNTDFHNPESRLK